MDERMARGMDHYCKPWNKDALKNTTLFYCTLYTKLVPPLLPYALNLAFCTVVGLNGTLVEAKNTHLVHLNVRILASKSK
jgi:hypothetical protein